MQDSSLPWKRRETPLGDLCRRKGKIFIFLTKIHFKLPVSGSNSFSSPRFHESLTIAAMSLA
jgi:hypothetical protein